MIMTKKKILLIDDDKDITMVVRLRLESEGYDVEVANSGKEGLGKIEAQKPDLVVLDVMMEDKTGYEVCAEIKAGPLYDLPVIMLTSRVRAMDEKLGFMCKADAYIRKPHSSELLVPEIKKLLGEETTK